MTGEEGCHADRRVRRLLAEGRYRFMGSGMHDPDTPDGRFDGLRMIEEEFGGTVVEQLTSQAPRSLIAEAY